MIFTFRITIIIVSKVHFSFAHISFIHICNVRFIWSVFDEHGNFKFKFGSKGRGDGQMSFPEGIAFLDWANGLLVADEGNNRVDFYNKDGKFRNHILVECDGILSPQGTWFRSYDSYHI